MRRLTVILAGAVIGLLLVGFAEEKIQGDREATRLTAQGRCGIERWAVKTLTDADARLVAWKPVGATVASLAGLPAPSPEPQGRIPAERSVERVSGMIVAFKQEADRDIHAVLEDPSGVTMIVEFPALGCTAGAQHRWAMEVARRKFIATFGQPSTSHFTHPNVMATVTGVLFFDRKHGQTGVAPNGVELHPVTGLRFP